MKHERSVYRLDIIVNRNDITADLDANPGNSWHPCQMLKPVILLVLVCSCGRDECADFATIMCGKLELCMTTKCAEVPGTGVNQCTRLYGDPTCENDVIKGTEAAHRTQDDCRQSREKITNMSCTDFNALALAAASR